MKVLVLIPLLAVLVLSRVQGEISSPPTATVECSPTGFAPNFTKSFEKNKTIAMEVYIGGWKSATPPRPCYKELSIVEGDENMVSSDLNADSASEIPFLLSGGAVGKDEICGALFTNDSTHIDYTNKVDIVITETIGNIKRAYRYEFSLGCKLTREAATLSSSSNWTIKAEMDRTGDVFDQSNNFTFPTSLDIYLDSARTYESKQNTTFSVKQGQDLFLRVSETTNNTLFKFVTKTCWSTPSAIPTDATKDVFWENKCPADETVKFSDKTDYSSNFDLQLKSFYFTADKAASISFHCDLYICFQSDATDPACEQKTNIGCQGKTKKRKRRDTGSAENRPGPIEVRTITSEQNILLPEGEIIVPECPINSVYDRQAKRCAYENVMEVKGIYLDLAWDSLYSDPTTTAFKDMALEKAYKLFTLVQFRQENNEILGVKVVKARKGSIILDVQIVYKQTISAAQAFEIFKRAIQEPVSAGNRIVKILEIRSEKVIEYVDIVPVRNTKFDDKILLIVLIIIATLVILIAGIVGVKFRQRQRMPAAAEATPEVKSYENHTLENVA